jgi:hypothetical protein
VRVMTSALIATLMLAGPARAQDGIPREPAPRDPPRRFSIARHVGTLAPIGLPLPQHGFQPLGRPGELPRRHRERGHFPWPMAVFYVPHVVITQAPLPEPAREPVERPPAPGRLILDVEPGGAQVFADGYYVGVPEDFSAARGGGLLEAGRHRIDVTAAGYEPMSMDLRVTSDQPITVRATLKSLPPPLAVAPTTLYLIPGCYMGNIPPKDARLPATCDQSRTITWRP